MRESALRSLNWMMRMDALSNSAARSGRKSRWMGSQSLQSERWITITMFRFRNSSWTISLIWFIVYDFGCLDQKTFFMCMRGCKTAYCNIKGRMETAWIKRTSERYKGMPGEDECKVLISSRCVGSDFGDVKELLPENTVLAAIPYESNPFIQEKRAGRSF